MGSTPTFGTRRFSSIVSGYGAFLVSGTPSIGDSTDKIALAVFSLLL
ncbi:MAG: hypothetical protein ACOX4L_07240 [Bacillota bacterium]